MPNSSRSSKAAAELLQRQRAQDDILHYVNTIDVPGKPIGEEGDGNDALFAPVESTIAAHHRHLLTKLETVSQTPHGRMMVFMPPGAAKSTMASVVFPSRYLGKARNRKLILASYGDDLARKMGRRTRSIIRQALYQQIFGTQLVSDSQAAQEFSLTNGSEYMACGMLAGITGNRANGIVIDDPIKGREQAESETIRKKTWDAYQDDILTRLVPGGFVVIIQTRWHQSDLAGMILPEAWAGESGSILCKDGNVWEVICLQARCEVENDPIGRQRGEYLWPEWFDRKHWAQFEQNPRTWSALYQQRPVPLEGGLFKPDKLKIIEVLPAERIQWVRGWDLASVEGGGDWTAGLKLGKMADGRLIIGDVRRGQLGPDDRDNLIYDTAAADGKSVKISIPQDPGQAGKTQVLYFSRKLLGYSIITSPESGDKVTRAEPIAAQVNAGNVSMLRGDWNEKLISELRMFPGAGTHDDQVDALSRSFSELIGANTMRINPNLLQKTR